MNSKKYILELTSGLQMPSAFAVLKSSFPSINIEEKTLTRRLKYIHYHDKNLKKMRSFKRLAQFHSGPFFKDAESSPETPTPNPSKWTILQLTCGFDNVASVDLLKKSYSFQNVKDETLKGRIDYLKRKEKALKWKNTPKLDAFYSSDFFMKNEIPENDAETSIIKSSLSDDESHCGETEIVEKKENIDGNRHKISSCPAHAEQKKYFSSLLVRMKSETSQLKADQREQRRQSKRKLGRKVKNIQELKLKVIQLTQANAELKKLMKEKEKVENENKMKIERLKQKYKEANGAKRRLQQSACKKNRKLIAMNVRMIEKEIYMDE